MICQLCDQEAVARCYACGDLVCQDHQVRDNCQRCETAIAAGDRRADRIAAVPLSKNLKLGWWRPIPAEDYDPPACYACGGLTRRTCRHCQSHYCTDHAGASELCRVCYRSSWLGIWVLLSLPALFVLIGLLNWLQAP